MVELLVVIAIISVLSTLGVANFRSSRLKARDVERKSNLVAVAKSLEAYVNDHSSYPLSTLEGLILCQPTTNTTCTWGSAFTDGLSNYMTTLPAEGNPDRSYFYTSDGVTYALYAYLENPNDPAIIPGLTVSCGQTTCNYQLKSSNQL